MTYGCCKSVEHSKLIFILQAELVYLRSELIDAKAQRTVLDQELHTLLLQLHACQLQHLPGVHTEPDAERIRRKLEEELQRSPTHQHRSQFSSLQDIIASYIDSVGCDTPMY